jgi:hypothetical protein
MSSTPYANLKPRSISLLDETTDDEDDEASKSLLNLRRVILDLIISES